MTCWVILGSLFNNVFGHVWCQEASAYENAKHMICDDGCKFSHDFQGPQGTKKTVELGEMWRQKACRFSDIVLGS